MTAVKLHWILSRFRCKREPHAQPYVNQLTTLQANATYSYFASLRMKLAWMSHSRTDVLFEVAKRTQVRAYRFQNDHPAIVKRTNRTVYYAQHNPVSIQFSKLGLRSLHIIGYSDASFAVNADLTSQLGYFVFVGDNAGAVIPIHFKSDKARRVVRSAMAAELISFGDMFEAAHTMAEELALLHPGSIIPVKLCTDNKCIFDVISKGTRTSETRLMLDIATARESFKNFDISDIGFVRTADNVADGLTKSMKQTAIRHILSEGRLKVRAQQWIVRDTTRIQSPKHAPGF